MHATYNRFSGQSLDRLTSLSDGIFAVAMTLLVLDIHIPSVHPDKQGHMTEQALWLALNTIVPHILPYLMSFMTLGIFWVGQQTQLSYFGRSDRNFAWIHLGFLLLVTLTPFSTGLLASFITMRIALVIYWLNILFLGIALLAGLRYGEHANLWDDADVAKQILAGSQRRIIIAQALYAFGALLCIISTYASIAVILLIQLNYVIAPKIRPLDRI